MGLYDFTFYDLISRNAQSYTSRPAWYEVDTKQCLNFSEFKTSVDRLACGLQQKGIQKGDRIGIVGKNSLEFFLLYGAAAAVGAIMLPVNWRLSADEVAFNLNDCASKIVFADQIFQKTVEGLKEKLSSVQFYFNLKKDEGGYDNIADLMENSGALTPVQVGNDDGFVIIHTAAVDGRPRGALISHNNLICANMHFQHYLGLTPQDVHLNFLPLFHVGGLFTACSGFHAGALNINMSKFDPKQAVDFIAEKKASFFFDFAPILGSILDEQEKSGADLSPLRAVVGLDTPETIERYQKVSGGTFYSMYGQTETSCLATMGPYNDRPGAAGQVIPMAQVRLLDKNDKPVAVGEVGEIAMQGPMVFKGYWGLDKDNAYTFRNGWHHTGDLGRFDTDGFLWYVGRKAEKELIKPGGENVYPAEVEKVILGHPAVTSVVVFGVPDPKWKEGIKAVCTLKSGQTLTAKELIDFVGDHIARYKRPQYVEFIAAMPVKDDGSIDRAAVKSEHGADQS